MIRLICIITFVLKIQTAFSQEAYDFKTTSGTVCLAYDKSGHPFSICNKNEIGECLFDKHLGCQLGQGSKFKKLKPKDVGGHSLKKWKKGFFTPEVVGKVEAIGQCKVTIQQDSINQNKYPKIIFDSPVKIGDKVNQKINRNEYLRYVLTLKGMDHGDGSGSRGMDHGGGSGSRGMDHGGGSGSRGCEFKNKSAYLNFFNFNLPNIVCESQ